MCLAEDAFMSHQNTILRVQIHIYIYISAVLQIGNVSIISEAYRRLFNFGAETLQRDYDLERAFN